MECWVSIRLKEFEATMSSLLQNAIESIQLGVEDYQANDRKRALSAVRNFYSGTLLLAKEVLTRAAPNADPEHIIGANYRPRPDGNGGVTFEQVGRRTVDFAEVGKPFCGFRPDHRPISAERPEPNSKRHRAPVHAGSEGDSEGSYRPRLSGGG